VETTVDRVGTDLHELAGRAKDLGSAAVFVSLLLTGIVWGLIGWQNLN
jgi:diacylglycerol kinase (ATP)